MEGTFSDEPRNLMLPVGRVVDVPWRLDTHSTNARDCAHKHRHGMRGVAESLHELLGSFMQHGVMRNVVDPCFQTLFFSGQFAVQVAGMPLPGRCSVPPRPQFG